MKFSYEQLTKIWRASARDNYLTREELESVEIDEVTKALVDPKSNISLRTEGHFVFGISQIWQHKAKLLLQDSQKTDENIGTAFRDYLQALVRSQQSSESRSLANADLQWDETLEIPQSLLMGNTHNRNSADGDISIDAIMRDDSNDELVDPLTEGENVMRSAEDQSALEQLDLGIDFSGGGGEVAGGGDDGPGNLDFGSDLAYSSSPPHTPGEDMDVDVEINNNDVPHFDNSTVKKLSGARRRRGAPIDEITTIQRPRKVLQKLLRPLPSINAATDDAEQYEEYIALDPLTEQLLDPEYVAAEMRRRRRVEAGEEEEPMDIGGDESVEFGNLELNDDLDLDLVENAESEDEDTPEMLETEQNRAREAIQRNLRRRGDRVEFNELASSSKARAATLMEVLAQAARGKLAPQQSEPWGSLMIVKA